MLDTSAYVAALLSKSGGAAEIFERMVRQQLFNFHTQEILEELRGVLRRPKFSLSTGKQAQFLQIIQDTSYETRPVREFTMVRCRDPKDDKFLSLANQIGADFLISLDQDLLVLKRVGKTRILSPGEYLAKSRTPPRRAATERRGTKDHQRDRQ